MSYPTSISCVFSNDLETLKKLSIDELKQCDDMGRNVFHAICSTGNSIMINYVLEKLGNDAREMANSGDNKGRTPAHYAAGLTWEKSKYWERNEE